jgi:hypothetical protein
MSEMGHKQLGAAMSLRAELVRLRLRWFVKRKIGPATTLEALRRQDAFLERLVPSPPRGTQATHVDLDGVKAVAVVTPASLASWGPCCNMSRTSRNREPYSSKT